MKPITTNYFKTKDILGKLDPAYAFINAGVQEILHVICEEINPKYRVDSLTEAMPYSGSCRPYYLLWSAIFAKPHHSIIDYPGIIRQIFIVEPMPEGAPLFLADLGKSEL
jgi:hypothetical protein